MTECNNCIKEDVCFIRMKHGHGGANCRCYADKAPTVTYQVKNGN